MKLIIILTIIGLIIGWRRGLKRYGNDHGMSVRDRRISCLLEMLGGFFVGAVSGFVMSLVLSLMVKSDHEPVEISRIDIHAMADGSGVSGRFFLGSGRIDNTEYYYYYESLDNGGFKQNKVSVNRATIFEDADSIKAYMIKYKMILPDDHWARGWAVLGGGECDCNGPTGPVEFHIPSGSVKHNYNLDLE